MQAILCKVTKQVLNRFGYRNINILYSQIFLFHFVYVYVRMIIFCYLEQ